MDRQRKPYSIVIDVKDILDRLELINPHTKLHQVDIRKLLRLLATKHLNVVQEYLIDHIEGMDISNVAMFVDKITNIALEHNRTFDPTVFWCVTDLVRILNHQLMVIPELVRQEYVLESATIDRHDNLTIKLVSASKVPNFKEVMKDIDVATVVGDLNTTIKQAANTNANPKVIDKLKVLKDKVDNVDWDKVDNKTLEKISAKEKIAVDSLDRVYSDIQVLEGELEKVLDAVQKEPVGVTVPTQVGASEGPDKDTRSVDLDEVEIKHTEPLPSIKEERQKPNTDLTDEQIEELLDSVSLGKVDKVIGNDPDPATTIEPTPTGLDNDSAIVESIQQEIQDAIPAPNPIEVKVDDSLDLNVPLDESLDETVEALEDDLDYSPEPEIIEDDVDFYGSSSDDDDDY